MLSFCIGPDPQVFFVARAKLRLYLLGRLRRHGHRNGPCFKDSIFHLSSMNRNLGRAKRLTRMNEEKVNSGGRGGYLGNSTTEVYFGRDEHIMTIKESLLNFKPYA